MDFLQSLMFMALYQLQVARDAPIPPALAAIVAAVLAWWVTKWRYGAIVLNLKRGIARRESELNMLREHTPRVALAPDEAGGEEVAERAAPAPSASSEHRRAMQSIVNAVDQADLALQSADPREADRAMASMGLALQTVQRMFDLPLPRLDGDASANLRTGKLFLEQVRPALRAGDDAQAQRLATAFVEASASAA